MLPTCFTPESLKVAEALVSSSRGGSRISESVSKLASSIGAGRFGPFTRSYYMVCGP